MATKKKRKTKTKTASAGAAKPKQPLSAEAFCNAWLDVWKAGGTYKDLAKKTGLSTNACAERRRSYKKYIKLPDFGSGPNGAQKGLSQDSIKRIKDRMAKLGLKAGAAKPKSLDNV